MPKHATLPTILNDCRKLYITEFKKWGYLKSGVLNRGVISWSTNGEVRSSIGAYSNMLDKPYIELDYNWNDEVKKYKIYLVTVPSNLGTGELYYFLCPFSGKRCRILHLISGVFCHRDTYTNVCYESQTYSKEMREADRFFRGYNLADKANEKMRVKHFTRSYKGKPTKRYQKLLKQVRHSQRYTHEDFMRIVYPSGKN
ncbi:hypothetical protein N8987_02615 [Crocinitomix sp.]|nr:hypothetical protein [Crocinitomix sp.]